MHHHILLPSKKQTLWLYLGWGQRTTLASTSTSSTGTGTGTHPAKKGLGAKKAAPVDFAEAERIRQLGYDREHEEASAQVAREAAALELKNKSATMAVSTGASSADVDKLGAGVKKLGFGAFPHAQPVTTPKACILPLRSLAEVA
jgi:ADP-ribosylation factor GTPase-activating protein 2/3